METKRGKVVAWVLFAAACLLFCGSLLTLECAERRRLREYLSAPAAEYRERFDPSVPGRADPGPDGMYDDDEAEPTTKPAVAD
jgi:hypothetical protein